MKNLLFILLISQIITKDFEVRNADPSEIQNSIVRLTDHTFPKGALLFNLEKTNPDLFNIENIEEKQFFEVDVIIREKLKEMTLGDEYSKLNEELSIFTNLSKKKLFNNNLIKAIKKILGIPEEETNFQTLLNAINLSIEAANSNEENVTLKMIPVFKKYSDDNFFFLQILFGPASLLKLMSDFFPPHIQNLDTAFKIQNSEQELQTSKVYHFYHNILSNDQIFFDQAKELLKAVTKKNYIINYFIEGSKNNDSDRTHYLSKARFNEIQILTGEDIGNDFYNEVINFMKNYHLRKNFDANPRNFYYNRNARVMKHDFENLERKLEISFGNLESHMSLNCGFFSSFGDVQKGRRIVLL